MTDRLKDGRKLPIFIHSIIDDMTALTPNAMRVYMHLARRADKSGCAWPSYQSIGDQCFISVSQNKATRRTFARKALDELLAAGLITKVNRAGELGNSSNVYTLIDPVSISTGGGVLNKHRGVPISTGVCLIGTEGTPIEDTPFEGTPEGESDAALRAVQHDSEPPPPAETKAAERKETKPPRQKVSPLDPRYLVDGLVKTGTATNAYEVYRELHQLIPTKNQIQAMNETVTDLGKWRDVLKQWDLRGYRNNNFADMLDCYRNGFRSGNGQPNGHIATDTEPIPAGWTWRNIKPTTMEDLKDVDTTDIPF